MIIAILACMLSCTIICCRSVARKAPMNYFLLGLFTLCLTMFVCTACSRASTNIVIASAGASAAMTFGLAFYAMCTDSDLSLCMGIVLIASIPIFFFSLFSIFIHFGSWWHPVLGAFGVALFGTYIMIDVQNIAKGRDRSWEVDDYIIAAMILYTDIMNLFLCMLEVFGGR